MVPDIQPITIRYCMLTMATPVKQPRMISQPRSRPNPRVTRLLRVFADLNTSILESMESKVALI